MAIERGPVMKRCRYLGLEPGFLGVTKKSKKQLPMTRKKLSEYGIQMKEKQKMKYVYNVLEKQFRNYFAKASRQKGQVGENLLVLLENRLDNIVFRMGFARTRREARQMVSHKSITVNGKKVSIASYQVKVGDVVAVKEAMKTSQRLKDIIARTEHVRVPEWLDSDTSKLEGKVLARPSREQIDTPVNETLIVELYSK